MAVCVLASGPKASAQSSRPGVGAIPYADAAGTGVTFRTWAPNATTVGVAGSFNGWSPTALVQDPGTPWNGYWSVDSSRARVNHEYKFVLNNSWRKDPRGKRVVNSAGNSIVYDPNAFDWGGHSFDGIWRNDLVIYQMHVGTYNAESWLPSTFDQALDKLYHIKSMGFSAVKLMPVNEFPGDRSWGYNPSDPYAIESAFGGPDALKRFVKTCHENGIAVIIDVVHNHYGPSDLEMWQYDGWSQNGLGGIYFYNDWRAHTMWGDTRPDFGRQEVRDYIQGQIRMFLEEYRVDGFRWDSVYNIRYFGDINNPNPDGSAMLATINAMVRDEFGDAYRFAEDHAFDTGGVGFESQWDHVYHDKVHWLATAQSDSDRNMNVLAYDLLSNGGDWRIIYAESHDSCGDLNNKYRLPRDIDSGNPQGYWAKKRALLAHNIVLVSPGIPMIFAGSEMNEDWTFSNNTALRWSLTNQNAGIVRAFSDLIHLRRDLHGVSSGLKQHGNVNVHHVDNAQKVVGVIRWDQGGQTDDLVIAINASSTPRPGYTMAFPSQGTWYCLYNSDSTTYDALFGGIGPEIGDFISVSGANASLDLGAYSMQIYSKTPIPTPSAASFDPPNPDGCGTTVTITYDPAEGPLAGADDIYTYIGRNNWQAPETLPMTSDGGIWTLDYVIPDLTYEINLSFTDGEDNWDNREGANWTVPVTNCGDLPSDATWAPYVPQGCVPLQITYHPNGGPLMGASNVFLHVGRNGWTDVIQLPLDPAGPNEWTLLYEIPDNTWQVDFVFFDEQNQWDNNNSRDWRIRVRDCMAVDQPYVRISSPDGATNVAVGVSTLPLEGRASLLAGNLRWTNQFNGASGTLPFATNWALPAVPVASGVNVIRVSGTNSHVNPNHGASDSPTNAAYASGWANGSNGGTGLQGWILGGTGHSMASNPPDAQLTLGQKAWAMQASGGVTVDAIRPFAGSLQPGDVVSFVFENGWVASGGSIGIGFQNRMGQNIVQFLFQGGGQTYEILDDESRDSGIHWNTQPHVCTLELLTPQTYRLTVNATVFEGDLKEDVSEQLISQVRFWNYNAGPEPEAKLYIGDLSIAGEPLPVFTYYGEVAVTRPADPAGRRVLSVSTVDGGMVAHLDDVTGIENNVWHANQVLERAWNWALLPASDYTISNNAVILHPDYDGMRVFSIGQPGGP